MKVKDYVMEIHDHHIAQVIEFLNETDFDCDDEEDIRLTLEEVLGNQALLDHLCKGFEYWKDDIEDYYANDGWGSYGNYRT